MAERRPRYLQRQARYYDNMFFHPIVCHVCKFLHDGKTSRCFCGMISYCCTEHEKTDRERSDENIGHGKICDVITKLFRENSCRFLGGTKKEWYSYKERYLQIVQKKLSRKLYPHEVRMLLSARSCFVCHKQTDLQLCPQCFCVDYCKEHCTTTFTHPCKQLKDWLFFEIRAINVNPVPQQTFHDFHIRYNVEDMSAFFDAYILPAKNESWTFVDVIYSDYLSGPLTVYFGMRNANIFKIPKEKNTYVIHIMGAKDEDKVYLPSWEIILHIFRRSMKLIIIMIGLDLSPELESGILQTCWEKCMPLGHELYFKCYRMSYNEYTGSALYKKPDVVVGFQVEFNTSTVVERFLLSLKSPGCPVILTTKSKNKAQSIIKEIGRNLGRVARPIVNEENKFRSHRPYRDYMTGHIYHRNQHLIIYEYLHITLRENGCTHA